VAEQVTQLLLAWGAGDESALERLIPVVHGELHRLARRYMRRERADHSLQPTVLVNETYLRLIDASRVQWQDRAHFYALCGRLMRRILVDHARSRRYLKRGGGTIRVAFSDDVAVSKPTTDLVALNDALASLAIIDARKCQVVEMRFFAGLSVEETAMALRVSPETVMRDWKMAKVWLLREIRKS